MIFWNYRPLFVEVGGAEGGGMHVPRTAPGGVFLGEQGPPPEPEAAPVIRPIVILDSGAAQSVNGWPAVDHDARVLLTQYSVQYGAPTLEPPAIGLSLAAAGRQGVWSMAPGQPVDEKPPVRVNRRHVYGDRGLRFDGQAHPDAPQEERLQAVRSTDFHWQFNFFDQGDGPGQLAATDYRQVHVTSSGDDEVLSELLIQGLVHNLWMEGERSSGRSIYRVQREQDIVKVVRVEGDNAGYVSRTLVDCWVTLARRMVARTPTPGAFDGKVPEGAAGEYRAVPGQVAPELVGWVRWVPDPPVKTLRDTRLDPEPTPPDSPPRRFTAAGGQVVVDGARSNPAVLDGAVLHAYGQSFSGGTWAALRADPGPEGDFARHLVVHESGGVVSTVTPDGVVNTLPTSTFEQEILRVPPGAFQGFSPVGAFSHSWPPQWAWANCAYQGVFEVRALAAHDGWRDSTARALRPADPSHWTWLGRPKRRPEKRPALAPEPPLGLTLADVTGVVQHDEVLARGEAPLRLPQSATVNGADVLSAVAKRALYQPAAWPEELNDRTFAASPLTLTYALDPGAEDHGAALVLRLKTRATTITVNGVERTLGKLGHNADQPAGWHPYVVPVPLASTYTLIFTGACSRALLYAARFVPPAP